MGVWVQRAMAGAVLVLVGASQASAEALFASPPHFVTHDDRRQIVFFLNEPVAGALAVRSASDDVEVIVPNSVVDPPLRGQDFGRARGPAAGVHRLIVSQGANGDATILISGTGPLGGVDARSEDEPPRLVIDLLALAPTRTPRPGPTRTASPRATRTAALASATAVPPTPAPDAAGAVATLSPSAIATPPPSSTPVTTATGGIAAPATPTAAASPAMDTPPADAGAQTAGPGETNGSSRRGLSCNWQRIAGVPFCAPDPEEAVYHADPALLAAAAALARGEVPTLGTSSAPAALYLRADTAFVTAAATGRLLPAITAYRRALRLAPDFADAPRARANIGLAYRAMGFVGELRSAAAAAAAVEGTALLQALTGDLARARGERERAAAAYAQARDGGRLGACLAARGEAALALEGDARAAAAAALARMHAVCPAALRADPETVQVEARAALAAGDAPGALAALTGLRGRLDPSGEGMLLADIATAAEAGGDVATARTTWEALARGAHGAAAARRATMRLAVLDGAGGSLDAGLERLDGLGPGQGRAVRHQLVADGVRLAIAQGAPARAVTLLHEQGLRPRDLPLAERVALARAYRTLGFADEAARLLAALRREAGEDAPDALWEEAGAAALAGGDAAAALATADAWLRRRGASGGALALKAEALAALGEAAAARPLLSRLAGTIAPDRLRAVQLAVGRRLVREDPPAAVDLLRAALERSDAPALPAAEAVAAWRALGIAAEAAGDLATARAAFDTLAERHAGEPEAAEAAYRAARLAARLDPARSAEAYRAVTESRDALVRRMGAAARDYEDIVRPLGAGEEAP